MASAEHLPLARDRKSKSTSTKSRSHNRVASATTTINPTGPDIRDARTSYYSTPGGIRASLDPHGQDRKTQKASGDGKHKNKSTSHDQKPLRRSHTGEGAVRGDLRGKYVYGSSHVSRDAKVSDRASGPKPKTRASKERVDSVPATSRKHAKESATEADIPGVSVRPALHRSASTSHSKPLSSRSTHNRSATVSELPSKKDNRRNSFLGSLFRTADKPRVRTAECLTCGSEEVPVTRSAKLACGHRMCNSCLKRIFTMSINDAAHMPPRCCTAEHIPLKYVDTLFDTKFKVLWNKKYEEYTTKNRLYCPARGCGTWIRPSQIHMDQGRKFGVCGGCKTKVCTKCNGKWHKRGECPKDEDTQKLLDIAKEKGWQRCYNCKAMVELKEGCNHLTCRCLAEFCMICGEKWKTCECPWFNYAQTADGDRLNHMRVPDIIPIVRRHVFGDPGHTPPAPVPERARAQAVDRNPALRYQEEADRRRRQVERDEALARRLQLDALRTEAQPHQSVNQEVFGNAGEHFLNDNFVQEPANIPVGPLRDTDFLRRGERQSNRRKPPRADAIRDVGLAPNAFGTESMLGFGPPPPPPPPVALGRSDTLKDKLKRTGSQNGGDRLGNWLSRLR